MSKEKIVRRFPIKSAGKLFYGPWPDVAMLRILKKQKVDTIWNLAEELKPLIPYEKYFVPNIIHGDIEDFYVPENMEKFAGQLQQIADKLKVGKNIFVHCFGGHGRTGMALAALDMMVSGSDSKGALQKAYGATGGPEEISQVEFVEDLSYFLKGKPIPKREKKQDFFANQKGYFNHDLITNRLIWVEESQGQRPLSLERKSPPEKPALSFMEWWGSHPEFKDYDAAKAYWAQEQKTLRKKVKKEKSQPEFCPYCGAHLMYPRDQDHIANHLNNPPPGRSKK